MSPLEVLEGKDACVLPRQPLLVVPGAAAERLESSEG